MDITDTKPTVSPEAQNALDHHRSGLDLTEIIAIWEGTITYAADGTTAAALFVAQTDGRVAQHTITVTRPGCYRVGRTVVSKLYIPQVFTHGPDTLRAHSENYASRRVEKTGEWVAAEKVTITGQVYGMAPPPIWTRARTSDHGGMLNEPWTG